MHKVLQITFFFEEWHKDVNLKSENILFHSFASPSKISEAFISQWSITQPLKRIHLNQF